MGGRPRSGRRPGPVPTPGTLLGRFALELRRLREESGSPSFETLSYETARLGRAFSDTSLRNACSGKQIPTWDVTEMFIRSCVAYAHGNPEHAAEVARGWVAKQLVAEWTKRWRALHQSDQPERPPVAAAPASELEGNLPAEVTSFVGRHRELAEARRMLRRSRLVTLTGMGGVGKTRLALRVATGLVQEHARDGVWLVELASLTYPEMVARTVAATLGIREAARLPLEAIRDFLLDKQLLLVLDNCEHLLEACAGLVRELLQAAPGLRVLATSRQPLGVTGEHIAQVSPLSLPGNADLSNAGEIARYDAIALFVDRASNVVPNFAVTEENRAIVARLCRRLDGIPLAIELAARRLRVLSLEDLWERLAEDFRLLRNGDRAGPRRHQALQAVFNWSYELCSPAEQKVWARLAVFEGGVALDAAEIVAADDEFGGDEVFDAVAGLVDKSILTRIDTGGQARFRLLDTLRQYGRDRLAAAGEEADVRRRHRDWCAELVYRAESEWSGFRQSRWYTRLRNEHANVRLALESFLADGEGDRALAMAGALAFYWVSSGTLSEGREWLERALAQPGQHSIARARALWAAGYLSAVLGELSTASGLIDQADEVAQGVGDARTLADVANVRGLLAIYRGEFDVADELIQRSLDDYREIGNPYRVQLAMGMLGVVDSAAGNGAEAIDHYLEAGELGAETGEWWLHNNVRWVLSVQYLQEGKLTEAAELMKEVLRNKKHLNDRHGIASVIDTFAWVVAAAEAPHTATLLLGAAHRIWPTLHERFFGFPNLIALHHQCVQQLRETLGEGEFTAIFEEGAQLSTSQAVSYALNVREPGQGP